MVAVERNSGAEEQDPFAQTRKIVHLVLQVPHHARDSGRVLDAVGCVLADLKVFERHQNLMKQLGSGITTQDVDNAREDIIQAAGLRPIDEAATEERILVLAGLQRIRQATEFNQRVAQRAQNGDGITIFQVGITSDFVEKAIVHVNEAKQLVEEAPRHIKKPEQTIEIIDIATEVVTEPEDIPVFAPPDDFISMQAGANTAVDKPKIPPTTQQVQSAHRPRGLTKRRLLLGGTALGALATAGQITKAAPILDWIADVFDGSPKTPEQAKDFIRNNTLSEKRVKLGNWYVMYPALKEDEEFVDVFSNFKQLENLYSTPIYAAIGENNPFPLLITDADVSLEVYESKFFNPLVAVKRGSVGSSYDGWFVVSGRKIPESPEQRPYPNVIQIENIATQSSFYLEVKPTVIQEKNRVEIRYMKKVKKSFQSDEKQP